MDQQRIDKAISGLQRTPGLKEKFENDRNAVETGCRTWNRYDLYYRLRSYQAAIWFCKPKTVDPITCARHGWINSASDTLKCETCRAVLMYPSSASFATDQQALIAQGFRARLTSAHADDCPWRLVTCDESLASFPTSSPEDLSHDYQTRLKAVERVSQLPPVPQSAMREFDQLRSQFSQLVGSESFESGQAQIEPESSNRQAFAGRGTAAFQQRAKIVALCGWETKILPVSTSVHSQRWNTIASETESAGRAILSCKLCGAKVGLWAFLPRARLQAMKSGVGPHSNDFLESNYEWSIAGGRQSVSPVPLSPIAASPNAESSMPDARGATARPGQARKAANPVFGVTRQSSVFGSLGRTVSLKEVHLQVAGAAGDEQSAPEASRADQGASPPVQPRGDGLSTAYLQTPASQQATGAESVNVRFSARSPAEDLQSTGGAAEETPAVPSAVQSAPEPSLEIVPLYRDLGEEFPITTSHRLGDADLLFQSSIAGSSRDGQYRQGTSSIAATTTTVAPVFGSARNSISPASQSPSPFGKQRNAQPVFGSRSKSPSQLFGAQPAANRPPSAGLPQQTGSQTGNGAPAELDKLDQPTAGARGSTGRPSEAGLRPPGSENGIDRGKLANGSGGVADQVREVPVQELAVAAQAPEFAPPGHKQGTAKRQLENQTPNPVISTDRLATIENQRSKRRRTETGESGVEVSASPLASRPPFFSGLDGNEPPEFDPLNQHRPFCAWRLTKDDDESWKTGWKVVLNALAPPPEIPSLAPPQAGTPALFNATEKFNQVMARINRCLGIAEPNKGSK